MDLPTISAFIFTAVCIWLAVRMVNWRARRPKWPALSIAALLLYVASWMPMAGLAEWLAVRDLLPGWATTALAVFYLPMQFAVAIWFLAFGG